VALALTFTGATRVVNWERDGVDRSSVWEIHYAAASGARQTGKTSRGKPRSWLGSASVISFVMSMAREASNAHEQEVQIGNPG
jgi:hypothetical protein